MKYKRKGETDFTADGHTMFHDDVLKALERKEYLEGQFEQLKKENEELKDLCREFASISRVTTRNHHVLVKLCDDWTELRQPQLEDR